jgi:hypothetical protein
MSVHNIKFFTIKTLLNLTNKDTLERLILSEKTMKETRDISNKLKFEVTEEVHDFTDDDGFEGRYVLGMKDGHQVMLCGMINTQSAANFWVVIVFEDGDHTAEKDGLAILHSIAQH